jgi:hypothetical protein
MTLKLIHGDGLLKSKSPNPELVVLLKDVLALAEKGELQSLALVALQSDGSVASGYSFETGFKVFTLVGLLEQMKQLTLEYAEAPE